jgi:hypothetical protein
MTVYVDELQHRGWILRGRKTESCHMIGDTPKELHALAAKAGLQRNWFQGDASIPHYDLVASRRRKAVALGVQEITSRELVTIWRKRTKEKR